jgi:hypothetical protein
MTWEPSLLRKSNTLTRKAPCNCDIDEGMAANKSAEAEKVGISKEN